MRDLNRFQGCLVGGAVGDALGYGIEFTKEPELFGTWGPEGLRAYKLVDGVAPISDDTQMTLFTGAGLLTDRALGREDPIFSINEAYLDWYRTQRAAFSPAHTGHSWLMNVPALYAARLPGTTCLGALGAGGMGTPEQPINDSKGCGGVMRVAPIGLYRGDTGTDFAYIDRLGAGAAALTHGHPLGWLSAAMLVDMIHCVAQEDASLPEAVAHAIATVPPLYPRAEQDAAYQSELLEQAVTLAAGTQKPLDAIHALGEGWVGEEALAIGVYCALRCPDSFEDAVILSVNHRGDSDSTGAVLGNLLGAKLGLQGIPERFLRDLELKDVILTLAQDLWQGGNPEDPVFRAKYADATWAPA
ncbi:MAG: ADP-ribosylglycohydrolase family protein [Clostridia bacterium]|nr:ADP-ribosylglycohydrolase family protein [Clostridia bacterium]